MGINSSLNRTDYKKSILYKFIKQLDLQMFAIIGLAFLFVFSYLPMFGIIIAFKEYKVSSGVSGYIYK